MKNQAVWNDDTKINSSKKLLKEEFKRHLIQQKIRQIETFQVDHTKSLNLVVTFVM